MFVDVGNISLAELLKADKGSLLIGDVHRARASMFVFEYQNESRIFEFADPQGQRGGFQPRYATAISPRYLVAKDFKVEVDISEASKIDPTRGNILPGQVVMSDDGPCFVLETELGSPLFISTSGVVMDEVDHGRVIGFSRWRIVIPGPLDTTHTIYQAGKE